MVELLVAALAFLTLSARERPIVTALDSTPHHFCVLRNGGILNHKYIVKELLRNGRYFLWYTYRLATFVQLQ